MITEKELDLVKLSPTKKDYYQIWGELLDLAEKLSERWSPQSTNESDPGIVLLKCLTAIADMLNYNIDKNILEAFMSSASQRESMAKLTEMMGYTMKYYQGATCDVSISYKDTNDLTISELFNSDGAIYFPKFVNLKNEDEDINYVTLEEFSLQPTESVRTVSAMEGELVVCETTNDNIITKLNLDDNNRYYILESNVAQNGIFVSNVDDSTETPWRSVPNLNAEVLSSKVFKFGYDSDRGFPYVQFPEDISQLIADGLIIRYIRTNGVNGNISARTLSKLVVPSIWATADSSVYNYIPNLTASDFSVTNVSAATNGADPESLNSAYNNFKKMIGTFDTLVTCRDYMNKIYQLTKSETNSTPLVSNVIVSDIRDDINKAVTLCSFNEFGICYSDHSLTKTENSATKDLIERFDLVLYPFKTVYGLNTVDEYKNSFKYDASNNFDIEQQISTNKTIAHKLVEPDKNDIICIKNYLKLVAKITTTRRVTKLEEANILANIKAAICKNFNSRQLDFGESIPYDTILEVLKNADTRIKDIILEEPTLYTVFVDKNNKEYSVSGSMDNASAALYNKLVLRNVLAGRIAAFSYDTSFDTSYANQTYPNSAYKPQYPDDDSYKIVELKSKFNFDTAGLDSTKPYTLKENEVIQFRMPNFKTIITYPAYVNYFLHLKTDGQVQVEATPARFTTLRNFLLRNYKTNTTYLTDFVNSKNPSMTPVSESESLEEIRKKWIAVYTRTGTSSKYIYALYDKVDKPEADLYYFKLDESTYAILDNYIKELTLTGTTKYSGIYKSVGSNTTNVPGHLVDEDYVKYSKCNSYISSNSPLDALFIQDPLMVGSTYDKGYGLGIDAEYYTLAKDSEYQLQDGEYLLINYTDSQTTEAGDTIDNRIDKYYGPDTIIKANFALIDSTKYNQTHSFSKKDKYYFAEVPDCPGMFTLGTNEQICIRDIAQIDLDSNEAYIYWTLISDNEDGSGEFEFTEKYGGKDNMAYTLKEGEYLYYTDSKKTDLAYYGAGTTVIKHDKTVKLSKQASTEEIDSETILTYGLAASIPWLNFRLGEKDAGITLIENQYINLTEGDEISALTGLESASSCIENEWCTPSGSTTLKATYRFAENEISTDLPAINVKGRNWSVRTRLDFNIGPSTPQTLYMDSTNGNTYDSITLVYNPSTITSTELKPNNAKTPLTLYANYLCQFADDTLKVNIDEDTDETVTEFKIGVTKHDVPMCPPTGGSSIALGNYSNNWTKFSFNSVNSADRNNIHNAAAPYKDVFTRLNIKIPSDKYGLIMVYYVDKKAETTLQGFDETTHNAGFKTDKDGICLFNTAATASYTKAYEFKPGINIIKVNSNVTHLDLIADKHTDVQDSSTVIFSNLSIINDINEKLDYKGIGTITALDQLLNDIRETGLGETFYYNIPIENTHAIDLNPNLDTDTLLSPGAWYDVNNVNNKFVISEIDIDSLKTGITLTKASKAY